MATPQGLGGARMTSQATSIAGIVLGALCLLIWVLVVHLLANPPRGDPAGNAIEGAFTALILTALWLLLGVLALVAWFKGDMPQPAGIAALVLLPVSGFVAAQTQELLFRQPSLPPYHWPIVIPALIPPLIVLFCLWALHPALRAIVPASVASWSTWGTILVLCLGLPPLQAMRANAIHALMVAQQKRDAAFAAMPPDAPLWDWLPYIEAHYENNLGEVLDKIRHDDRRQSDAEIMLDRGDFPLRLIGGMDLTPTQAICDKARALLRRQAAQLVPPVPNEKPFNDVRIPVEGAIRAIQWLVGYECPCDAESQAWQAVAEAYRDPAFDIENLKQLRDPRELGRKLRESPARFSMLSPKSHLKAWLSFADDRPYRERALAGARALDHRTADAIAMLTDKNDIRSPVLLMTYLPSIDLEATPPLCDAALARLHDAFSQAFHPKPEDHQSFDALLGRLGVGDPLTALLWLAEHGCNADAVIGEAMDLVRAHDGSPERAAMLARLEQLRRTP